MLSGTIYVNLIIKYVTSTLNLYCSAIVKQLKISTEQILHTIINSPLEGDLFIGR